ncbi:LytR/AlgR family response regulator transcription factor [Butyrivibrio sp. WCE2006]|uniref:LytR/AlgR family response regulator transcription factor n=1 Tax=Butyrivibrio sp. WCE2006 TaxID=1410611 RepID=UPI000678EF64|nr:LytTR family DNA-binding domain-containing protein [Butyrivibrio sp. WCE2006]
MIQKNTKLKIGICDDEAGSRQLIITYLYEMNPEIMVKQFSSGEELLEKADIDTLDVLFLDIAMGEKDGMCVAKEISAKIRANGRSPRMSKPLIIFITGIPDRIGDAFGVSAFDYLVKPVNRDKLENVLKRAEKELALIDAAKADNTESIMIQVGGSVFSLNIDEIYYIESANRKIIVHTKTGNIETYGKISDWENRLGNDFFRIHRSYLIQMKYVRKYNRIEAEMADGSHVLMSKYKYQEFLSSYMEYISK